MTLNDYLAAEPDTASDLARRCGVSPATISRVRKGTLNTTLDLARAIVRETGGKVTFDGLAKARDEAQ